MIPRIVTALLIGFIAGALLTAVTVGAREGRSLGLCPIPPLASPESR